MELVTPGIGLVFWMLLSFTILLLILKKYAWKPILKALKDREDSIEGALHSAKTAKHEMEQLQAHNEKIVLEARAEKDKILKEAREVKTKILSEAKDAASHSVNKLMHEARQEIHNEKAAAITDIKNIVALLSIDIAEKILEKELSDRKAQQQYVKELLNDIHLN